jgi:hypothetical protein
MTAAVALAGCGGRSQGEAFREDSLKPAQQRAELKRARVAATLRVVRPGSRRDAGALGEDIDAYAAGVRQIAGLVPPADARPRFDGYVKALRGLVAELRRLNMALRRDDRGAIQALAQRVQDDVGAVQRGDDALQTALLGNS